MRRVLWFLTPFLFLMGSARATAEPVSDVDLHAHFFMQKLVFDGLGPHLFGSFSTGIKATRWKSRLSSRADAQSLDASGMRLVVLCFYVHPFFPHSMREQLRDQLGWTDQFVKEHPNWMIARSADEAQIALKIGKKVLVLALEGASGVFENEQDIEEFVDQRGIRIVTPLHFTDDPIGGAALLPGFLGFLANPIAHLRGWRTHENPRGLAVMGEWLIAALAKHGVWIDFSHASRQARAEILKLLEAKDLSQPPLLTHAPHIDLYPAERAPTHEDLRWVEAQGGIAGAFVSQDMLGPTSPGEPNSFRRYLQAFSQQLSGPLLGFGSDVNAPISGLAPEPEGQGGALEWIHYGSFGKFRKELEKVPYHPALTAEGFCNVWKRVKAPSIKSVP